MAYRRGEIVLVPFPFTDLSTTKVGPAVVLCGADYQRVEPDLLLGAIPSRIQTSISPMDHVIADWRSAGLRFPSLFKTVLFTLDHARVIHSIGNLSPADLAQIDIRLRRALDR